MVETKIKCVTNTCANYDCVNLECRMKNIVIFDGKCVDYIVASKLTNEIVPHIPEILRKK